MSLGDDDLRMSLIDFTLFVLEVGTAMNLSLYKDLLKFVVFDLICIVLLKDESFVMDGMI